MRGSTLSGTACILGMLWWAASCGHAAEKPHLELTDEGLPLQEIRPLDRHVYILTLEGKWNQPVAGDMKHYINVLFPNGKSVSHRVQDETMFRKGEVRCVLIQYELLNNDVAKGGDFVIVVSERNPVDSATAKDVISDPLKVSWPMERVMVSRPVRTRHTPPPPIDAMPLPDDPLLKNSPARPQ
jgi:hypothetical protein